MFKKDKITIEFPFVVYVDDYHEFGYIKSFFKRTFDIDLEYDEHEVEYDENDDWDGIYVATFSLNKKDK